MLQRLVGDQYSWASSAFYFNYLVASYPVSLCFVKFSLGKFLSLTLYAAHGFLDSINYT
jgi:hypothetical protein